MKKLANRNTALAVAAIYAVSWIVIVLLFINYENGISWMNFGFGVFSYIILAGMIIWSDAYIKRKVAVETYGSTIYFSLLYACLSGVFNAICIFADSQAWKFIVAVNLLLLAGGLMIILFSIKYVAGISEETKKIADSIKQNRDIKKELQGILLVCEDNMLKNELMKLKELVEYSDRMGKQSSKEYEENFCVKLDELKALVIMKANQDRVLSVIKDATNIWKQRNANI